MVESSSVVNYYHTDVGPNGESISKEHGGGHNPDGVNVYVSQKGNPKNKNDTKVGIFFHEMVGHGHPDSPHNSNMWGQGSHIYGRGFGGRSLNDHAGRGGYNGDGSFLRSMVPIRRVLYQKHKNLPRRRK